MRLSSLLQRLTQYQLELSNAARHISIDLQREVLTSLLFTEAKSKNLGYKMVQFDESTEKQRLVSAYRQLGVSGQEITKKINEHVSAVADAFNFMNKIKDASAKPKVPKESKEALQPNIFGAFEAYKATSDVVKMSLTAESKTKAIFSQIDLFVQKLKAFIPDKKFAFVAGELIVENEGPVSHESAIPLARLSSGEKQLLILFVEALLQRQQPYIFLADEPELSLHIAWQRNIIQAIREINQNAQIVVATHSPEIAAKFKDSILDMEDILHG